MFLHSLGPSHYMIWSNHFKSIGLSWWIDLSLAEVVEVSSVEVILWLSDLPVGTFVGFSLRSLEIKKPTEKPVYKIVTMQVLSIWYPLHTFGLVLIEVEYAEKLAARRKEVQEILDQMDSKAISTNNNGRDLLEGLCKFQSCVQALSFGFLPQEEETKLQAEEHLRLVQARFLRFYSSCLIGLNSWSLDDVGDIFLRFPLGLGCRPKKNR